jgi:hypothetical protein
MLARGLPARFSISQKDFSAGDHQFLGVTLLRVELSTVKRDLISMEAPARLSWAAKNQEKHPSPPGARGRYREIAATGAPQTPSLIFLKDGRKNHWLARWLTQVLRCFARRL